MITVFIDARENSVEGVLLKPTGQAGEYAVLTREEYDRGDIDLEGVFHVRDLDGEVLTVKGWSCPRRPSRITVARAAACGN